MEKNKLIEEILYSIKEKELDWVYSNFNPVAYKAILLNNNGFNSTSSQ